MSPLILWDWDNTLADTFQIILDAQHDTQKHFGVPLATPEQVKLSMNKPSLTILREMVGNENAIKGMDYFWQAYMKRRQYLTLKPYARALLDYAHKKGFINVLASNKEIKVLLEEVQFLNVGAYFDRVVGSGSAKENKPSLLFLENATEGFSYTKLISVGDGLSDVQMVHKVPFGISILVASNPNSPEFKDNPPEYACTNLKDVQKILTEIFQ